jgi:hypothetical protein
VLNVHATAEDTSNDTSDIFCKELQPVFDVVPRYLPHESFVWRFQCKSRERDTDFFSDCQLTGTVLSV